ncbi:LacI family DNA-binding transcriptional regulator [uncultured Boseongicola sp.]|jgi:LacI family transcriptional regulator|uniref:LacI family DNA-binding transcriptional regulator n=1 Tax=uncultured Boseongicola sp. TaxID=1648499 RepID=UPI0026047D35|nr:LacI family DNA-binding transcriptional regulator [uncultured Boseongicola sp.]
MIKSVTLKDIARETGVHTSTVSRALDPEAKKALTDEVVDRVRNAAQRMGYRRNRLASGLRTSRTMTVGLLIPDITNTLFPPIVRGVESILESAGYASIIVNTDNDIDRESKLVEVLLERGVDGIIDAAAHRSDPRIVEVAQENVPVVTVNRLIEGATVPSVVNDDAEGIRMLLDHLYAASHHNIAHIAGPKALSTGVARRLAFEQTTKKMGLQIPKQAIVHATRFDEDAGWLCAGTLLQSNWKFTAILCANDRLAIGAIDYLEKHGMNCPKDISVTGFNDLPFLDRISPGLTTIRVEQFEVGRLSAELLVKMMKDPTAEVPPTTVLPVQLIERASVAAPKT